MDPVRIEKLQAMKRYRRKQFLPTLIQYLLSVLIVGLFLSRPLWFPNMCSKLKVFFFVSLPKMWGIVFGPKCLFVVCNIIIIFLVGESQLSKTSVVPNIYEEYVEQQRRLRMHSSGEAKKENVLEEVLVEEREEQGEEVEEEAEEKDEGEEAVMQQECKDLEGGGEEGVEGEEEDLEEEEERGLPPVELKKRAEDFIAKFNMQRRLEARMLVCHGSEGKEEIFYNPRSRVLERVLQR